MSSTILHINQGGAVMASAQPGRGSIREPSDADVERNPFLVALGERARALRARRGLTRKAVAVASDVSERHLANLEGGSSSRIASAMDGIAVVHCVVPATCKCYRRDL